MELTLVGGTLRYTAPLCQLKCNTGGGSLSHTHTPTLQRHGARGFSRSNLYWPRQQHYLLPCLCLVWLQHQACRQGWLRRVKMRVQCVPAPVLWL